LKYTVLAALIAGFAGSAFAQSAAPPPTKIAIINIQAAIAATKDGQRAQQELQKKFDPTRSRLEKKNAEIEADKAALARGSNAMSAEQKEKLMRDIDQKTKALNRDMEDAQAEVDQETGKLMQELGGRMMTILNKYARDNGYALVMDVPPQQTPVLYASDDLTETMVKLYDQNSPATAAPPAAAPPKPGASAPSPAAAPKTPAAAPSSPAAAPSTPAAAPKPPAASPAKK
jgi:outer membrane protein